ncbi:hypothetical protein FAGKG844_310006 [Frankia sp. AgKG'84/4]
MARSREAHTNVTLPIGDFHAATLLITLRSMTATLGVFHFAARQVSHITRMIPSHRKL